MTRMIVAACAIAMVLGGSCRAQVISGESTYEDNFEHDPPSASRETAPPMREDTATKRAGGRADAPAERRE